MTTKAIVFVKKECGPSQQYRAALKKHLDIKNLQVINVDSYPSLARDYKLKALPTTLLIEDDSVEVSQQKYKTLVGYSPELINRIKEHTQ